MDRSGLNDSNSELIMEDVHLKENKSIYVGLNNQNINILQVKIDGGYIKTSSRLKCDYLLLIDSINKAYYVELKGIDIIHGINQIWETINTTHELLDGHDILCRIVTTRYIKYIGPKFRNIPSYLKLSRLIGHDNIKIEMSIFRDNLS